MKFAVHAFAFDAVRDSSDDEVLEFRYGAGQKVSTSSDVNIRQFGRSPQRASVSGDMPVGDTLYVKWRVKADGQVSEDTVNLKPLLPPLMDDKEIYFVVRGAALSVFLTDLKRRRSVTEPIVGPFKTQLYLTRQIYPAIP